MNFTPCFGYIHSYNRRFVTEYALLKGRQHSTLDADRKFLEDAVFDFRAEMERKVGLINDFRPLTVDPSEFDRLFLTPVLKKMREAGNDAVLGEEATILERVQTEHRRCTELILQRSLDQGRAGAVGYLTKIPLQIFIADIEGKDTCLVFFIVTDNILTEKEIKGFYTEFPDVVRLFKTIFEGIRRDHEKLPTSEREAA